MGRRLSATVLRVIILAATPGYAQMRSFPREEDLSRGNAGDLITTRGEYGDYESDCGFLLAPENRADPDSRVIRLAVVRQRALEVGSSQPIFTLIGGPGKSTGVAGLQHH